MCERVGRGKETNSAPGAERPLIEGFRVLLCGVQGARWGKYLTTNQLREQRAIGTNEWSYKRVDIEIGEKSGAIKSVVFLNENLSTFHYGLLPKLL